MSDPITAWTQTHRVHPSIPRAIRKVEAGRMAPVDAAGRPLIRFEAHVFIRQLGLAGASAAAIAALARRHFSFDTAERWKNQRIAPRGAGDWKKLHTGSQVDEHNALQLAIGISRKLTGSPEAAFRSASYGIGQIMGFHVDMLGYPSAQHMFQLAAKGERSQIEMWLRFLERKPGLLVALQRGDLWTVAKLYNGTGQPEMYARKLQQNGATGSTHRPPGNG